MWILYIIPKSWLSFAVGKLCEIRSPRCITQAVIRWYIGRYTIDLSEIAEPLEHFDCLAQFFTRTLKAGARHLEAEPVSPVDGTFRNGGHIKEGTIIQVKGISYAVEKLLGDSTEALSFADGTFLSFYLSPKDYHHVHAPVTATIEKITHIPGALWPVNDWSLHRITDLFAINERIIIYFSSPFGRVAVVMVGAVNVGRMSLTFHSLETNRAPWQKLNKITYPVDHLTMNVGDRLGTFHLGSSVVLLFDKQFSQTYNLGDFKDKSCSVLYGKALSALHTKSTIS